MERRGVKGPVIIAMKGYPCTGKTAIGWRLAQSIRCPLIGQDCVRDCISSLRHSLQKSPTEAAKHLDDLSFEAICRIATRQLRFGFHLIIDSPLSRRSHLDRLLQISSSTASHLVIVECKPQDKYVWRQRLELRAAVDGTAGCWYRPSTWEDLEKLFEWYDGCSDYDTGDVSKIIVDTTDHVKIRELEFAVQTVAASPQCHCIDYQDFADLLGKGLVLTEGESQRKERLKKDEEYEGHHPHYHALGLSPGVEHSESDGGVTCRACLKPISEPAYKCFKCDLRLHKLCAELPHETEIKPQDFPTFLRAIPREFSFPEIVRCNHCESHNKDYKQCHECLFESYIRCALLPSVLQHPCHEHALYVKIDPISYNSGFQCQACGDPGNYICYCCYECVFKCHLACAVLPHNYKQEHHRHPLTIASLPEDDESEEFLCDACETPRNSKFWMYHCAECDFACHLSCMSFAS
ncbi:hypothetical protein U1Q18_016609 [Sarracenia purpurea var. burkii]